MMKKVTQKKSVDSVELRRWCVEKAMHWPISAVHGHGALGGMQQALYQQPHGYFDQDVIARAEKLLQWVTKK